MGSIDDMEKEMRSVDDKPFNTYTVNVLKF